MGLNTWETAPDGKIVKTDVSVAKYYLTSEEIGSFGRIVNTWLDLAEDRAHHKIPMTMEDWASRLDQFLAFDDREVLNGNGNISTEQAKKNSEDEFEKLRLVRVSS